MKYTFPFAGVNRSSAQEQENNLDFKPPLYGIIGGGVIGSIMLSILIMLYNMKVELNNPNTIRNIEVYHL